MSANTAQESRLEKSEIRAMIYLKRAYEESLPEDGLRFLVDRLWPRGVEAAELALDGWFKEIAPSDGLGRWFGHDSAK